MFLPENLCSLPVSKDIADHDQMISDHLGHYYGVGISALWTIQNILRCRESALEEQTPITTVLDFGCGCGRIGRFLRAGFPSAQIHVTDVRKQDVEWYIKTLSADLAPDPLPDEGYDLIWLGSVFTHLAESAAKSLLARLLSSLRIGGVLAFSTQGRFAYRSVAECTPLMAKTHPWLTYNLPTTHVSRLLSGYEANGYGYVDYPGQAGYGVSVVDAAWYSKAVFSLADVTQIFFQEKALDDHQDVLAFMRRGICDSRINRFVNLGNALATNHL
jgi:SAM-dependent methyltransferase